MKRAVKAILIAVTAAIAFAMLACKSKNEETPPVPAGEVTVAAAVTAVTLEDFAIDDYDYTQLFTVTVGETAVEVLPAYVNRASVRAKAGEYTVTCTYREKSAQAKVKVVHNEYAVLLSKNEITLHTSRYNTYNYLALFSASKNGTPVPVTPDMAQSDVRGEAGDYAYTVRYGNASKTLTVHITNEHDIEIAPAYRLKEIEQSEAAQFDATALFSLYVDGSAVRVTADMIDASALRTATAGNEVNVTMQYALALSQQSGTARVKVVADRTVTVSAKNVTVYPNSGNFDLTTLFEIKKGEEVLPVPVQDIEGSIDYGKEGAQQIVLNYGGNTYIATVTVSFGVRIELPHGDRIHITAGRNQATYPFASDFAVWINGIRFTELAGCIDTRTVVFPAAGTYTATLTVPYNTQPVLGATAQPQFEYFIGTVDYIVEDVSFSIEVKQETVVITQSQTEYDPLDNLTVTVNGVRCGLTHNRDWATSITCYASFAPIDFTRTGARTVEIAVYVRGTESDPERVSFTLNVQSQVEITATDRAVFAGGTAYAPDLFRITENGQAVETTHAMIEGKADTFTPGVYTLTATYKNVSAQATVTVYPAAMKGTYKTKLTTIPDKGSNYDEEEGEDDAPAPVRVLGDLVIADDGSITVDGKAAANVTGIDENTLGLTLFGSFAYTLYYENGIAVLSPVNSHKISFNNSSRPMVYFAESVWNVGAYVTVNYTTQHVLYDVMPAYSIDTFCLTAKAGGKEYWYGLKTQLVRRTASDTEYAVTWGEAKYSEGFRPVAGVSAAVAFGGETYNFTMTSVSVGKVNRETTVKKYPNRTFRGTVDGKAAVLATDSAERYTLTVDGKTVVNGWGNESDIANDMVRGGCDYVTDEVRLNSFRGGAKGVFSYAFTLDPQNNTFTYKERDGYFGKYACGDMYVFLDGYGYGCMAFDATSFARTEFSYDVRGNELHVAFGNVLSDFVYGNGAVFFISPLRNVLTVKESVPALRDKTFTMLPELVSDGAIVTFSEYVFTAGSQATTQIRNAVTVIDKNGEWTDEQKRSNISLTTIKGTVAGFYKVTVSVQVNGATATQVFAVQIVSA